MRYLTYPLQNSGKRILVLDIKAKEDAIPLHVRQSLNRVQVWRARGVLHFDADRLRVVHAVVGVRLVTSASDGARLHCG